MNKIAEALIIEKIALRASDYYNYNNEVNEMRDNKFTRPVTEEEYGDTVRSALAKNIKNVKGRWSKQKGRAETGESQTKEEVRGAVLGHGVLGGGVGSILGGILKKRTGALIGGIGGSILAGGARKLRGAKLIKDPGAESDFQGLGKAKELQKNLKNPKSELYRQIIMDPIRNAERKRVNYPDWDINEI